MASLGIDNLMESLNHCVGLNELWIPKDHLTVEQHNWALFYCYWPLWSKKNYGDCSRNKIGFNTVFNLTQVTFPKAIKFDLKWKNKQILAPCDEQLQQIWNCHHNLLINVISHFCVILFINHNIFFYITDHYLLMSNLWITLHLKCSKVKIIIKIYKNNKNSKVATQQVATFPEK